MTAPRRPELRAGQLGGLGIPDARSTRVRVEEDGTLVLTRADGVRRVLAAPGEITRVSAVEPGAVRATRLHPPARDGLVLLWRGDALAAAFSVGDWFRHGSSLEGHDLRVAAGFDALAEALGLVVEAATGQEASRARRLRTTDLVTAADPATAPPRALPAAVAVLVLATLALVAAGTGRWWALAAPVAAVTPLVLGLARRRAAFARQVAAPLPPLGRVAVRPAPPLPTTVNLAETELQVGPEDVVLRFEGTEWWLPGPAAGGITRAHLHPDLLLLTDRRDRVLLPLDGDLWGTAAEEVARALERAGAEVVRAAQPSMRLDVPVPPLAVQGHWPLRVGPRQDGGVDARLPVLLDVTLGVLLLGLLAAPSLAEDGALPWVACGALAVLVLGLAALMVRAARTAGAWQRRQRRWVGRLPEPGHRATDLHRRPPTVEVGR